MEFHTSVDLDDSIEKHCTSSARRSKYGYPHHLACSLFAYTPFLMAVVDYEEELQTEIVQLICSRDKDCVMKFVPKPRHIKLGMEGLLWSIEALPLSGRTHSHHYTFNIMEVKRSAKPRSFSDAEQPELPPKFKHLLAEEALDKMYGFSRLFARTEEDERWWTMVDAEIAGTACVAAREAVREAAMAIAAIFPPPPVNPTNLEDCKVFFEKRERLIEGWTPADELWATSFSERRPKVRNSIDFLSHATRRGDVLQWCGVHVNDTPIPSFEILVDLDQFLEGDDVVLRIGVFSHLAVRVRVSLTDNVDVACSQEGVDSQTSLGLGYLLPELVRDYLRINADNNSFNVVEGLLRRVVRYLGLLSSNCVVCGSDRLLPLPPSSACDNICKARKKSYMALLARTTDESAEEEGVRRREYATLLYPDTWKGRVALNKMLEKRRVVKKGRAGEEAEIMDHEAAVSRVSKMPWRRVAAAMRSTMLGLWKEDRRDCGQLD